jgi:cyclic pyranopterin phosphate synthase
MPPDAEFLPRAELLSYEEIARVVRVAAGMGIRKVRLTGGEPLARRGLLELVGEIGSIPQIEDLALSTNGVLLARHARALKRLGLQRVNISLDSLRPERFAAITRFDRWRQVMDGIEAALEFGLRPVKINCVVIRGVNDDEIEDFIAWTLRAPVHVRFIEYMPIGVFEAWDRSRVVSLEEMRQRVEAVAEIEPIVRSAETSPGPAKEFRVRGGLGSVGFISALTCDFCADCNRVRLTSEGKLRGCLFSAGEVDLRGPLRAGIDDEVLRELLVECLRRKPESHLLNAPAGTAPPPEATACVMHRTGG